MLRLDLSTMRIDSSLKSYHRFLIFDGLSDFFRNFKERILFSDTAMSVTMRFKSYLSSHITKSRLTA